MQANSISRLSVVAIAAIAAVFGFLYFADLDGVRSSGSEGYTGVEPSFSNTQPSSIGVNGMPDGSETSEVLSLEEREVLVLEKEQELIALAEDYDQNRSDREKRAELIETAETKLQEYNEAILPLLVEKTKQAPQP